MAAEDVLLEVQRGGELTLRDPKGRVWPGDVAGGDVESPIDIIQASMARSGIPAKAREAVATILLAAQVEFRLEGRERAMRNPIDKRDPRVYDSYLAYEAAVLKSAKEAQAKWRNALAPEILDAVHAATARLAALQVEERTARAVAAAGAQRPDVIRSMERRVQNILRAQLEGLAAGRGGLLVSDVFSWLGKHGAIAAAERMINDPNIGAAGFRQRLRDAVFSSTITRTKEFAARVLKAANFRKDSPGNLHGGLLEVLRYDAARADAMVLNGLRDAANAGSESSKAAYRKMLDDIFLGQDAAAIIAATEHRRFKWIAGTSGTQFQDDVRLAAVELNRDGRVATHRLENDPRLAFDHALVSKVYECKDIDTKQSVGLKKGFIISIVDQILARAIQEYRDHQLERGPAEINVVIADWGMGNWKGVEMPHPLEVAIESLSTRKFAEDKRGNIPPEWKFHRSGFKSEYAKIDLSTNPFTITTETLKGRQVIKIEFDCDVVVRDSAGRTVLDASGNPVFEPLHVTEIVAWDTNIPGRNRYTDYITWLHGQLNKVMPAGQANTFFEAVDKIARDPRNQ
ncbi:MAG: hypothetical protein Q6373_017345, partial [Candidatus Sigynarchaeota archaeon]